jgi:hypothetical protein
VDPAGLLLSSGLVSHFLSAHSFLFLEQNKIGIIFLQGKENRILLFGDTYNILKRKNVMRWTIIFRSKKVACQYFLNERCASIFLVL